MNTLTHTEKTTARDFFLYLLTMGLLFTCMWGLISLWFALLDIWMPNYDIYGYFSQGQYGLRSALATLIIAFPVYFGLTWFLRKDIIRHPEKSDMGVRKILLYLTLFVTSLTIIIDLITLVRNFLDGEITLRFILQVLVVLIVAGSAFIYYLWDVKRETTPESKPSIFVALIAVGVFCVSIGLGFGFVDSPFKQRLVRMDNAKINQLQMLENSIQNYWFQNKKLPPTEEALAMVGPPDATIEYKILDETKYELCAVFETDALNGGGDPYSKPYPMMGYEQNWYGHGKGRTCYTRNVSPITDSNLVL